MKAVLKLIIISFVSVVAFGACEDKRYFSFEDLYIVKAFPETYDPVFLESLNLGLIGVQGIKVLDDYITVSCNSDQGCICLVSTTGKLQSFTLLKNGNGPGEVLYRPFISWMSFSQDGRYAYIYDHKGNYLEYDLLSSISEGRPFWRCLAEDLSMADGARYFYIDKERLLCRKCKAGRDGYERQIVDSQGNVISALNIAYLNAISSSDMNLLSTGFAINSKLNRIAEFGSRLNVIHLYSYEYNFARTLSIGDKVCELDDMEQLPDEKMFKMYYDSKSFDDYFAALYLGATIEELDSGTFGNPRIHIFDWDGNPIAEIKVPVRSLFFDIDVDDGILYIVEYETEHILKYDISEICDILKEKNL